VNAAHRTMRCMKLPDVTEIPSTLHTQSTYPTAGTQLLHLPKRGLRAPSRTCCST
jgi:hypothetical protein